MSLSGPFDPAVSPFMNELIGIASVEDLGEMMTKRLGKPIDLSGGPLYLAKFVAAELEAWRAVHPDLPGLKSLAYADDLGDDTGLAYPDGRILLNRTHFSTPDKLLGRITRTGLNHVIDEEPEFGAAFVVRHELTHTRGFAKQADHGFIPDLLAADRNHTEDLTISAAKAVNLFRYVGLITNEEADQRLTSLLYPPEHSAFKEQPVLYALNDRTVGRHISPYGLKNKVEAFAEAGAKVSFAGAAAGEASLTLLGLGGPIDAEVAAAERHVADLVQLRRRLDPRTGLAADPAARDTEIAGGLLFRSVQQGVREMDAARAAETQTLPRDQVARPPDLAMSLLGNLLQKVTAQAIEHLVDGRLHAAPTPHAAAHGAASSLQNAASVAADPPGPAALPVAGATTGARSAAVTAFARSSPTSAAAKGFSALGPAAARSAGAATAGRATHASRAAAPSVAPPGPAHARPTPTMRPANAGTPARPATTAQPSAAIAAYKHGIQTTVPDLSSYVAQAGSLNPAPASGGSPSAPLPRSPSQPRPAPATFRNQPRAPHLQRQVGDDRFA